MYFNHRMPHQKFLLEKNGTIRCSDERNVGELVLGLNGKKGLCLVRPHMDSVLIFDTPLQKNTKYESKYVKSNYENILDFVLENYPEWRENNVQADQVEISDLAGLGGASIFMLKLTSETKEIKNKWIVVRHGNEGNFIRQPERCNDASYVLEKAQIYPKTLFKSEEYRILAFGGNKSDINNNDNIVLLAKSMAKLHQTPTDWYESYKKETLQSDLFKEIDLSAYPNIDTSFFWV